jgi:hypothetical protein
MANWCSARLIVAGRCADVLKFSQRCRARPGVAFRPDMLYGETAELRSERVAAMEPGLSKKEYTFQIRNDDGQEHFCQVSRQFPALSFVLIYWDPNNPPSGSYLISRGRARGFELPDPVCEAVMEKHGVTAESDDDFGYWEAAWELMDLAEAQWRQPLLRALRRQLRRPTPKG